MKWRERWKQDVCNASVSDLYGVLSPAIHLLLRYEVHEWLQHEIMKPVSVAEVIFLLYVPLGMSHSRLVRCRLCKRVHSVCALLCRAPSDCSPNHKGLAVCRDDLQPRAGQLNCLKSGLCLHCAEMRVCRRMLIINIPQEFRAYSYANENRPLSDPLILGSQTACGIQKNSKSEDAWGILGDYSQFKHQSRVGSYFQQLKSYDKIIWPPHDVIIPIALLPCSTG